VQALARDNPYVIWVVRAKLSDYQNPSSVAVLRVMSHPLFSIVACAYEGGSVVLQ